MITSSLAQRPTACSTRRYRAQALCFADYSRWTSLQHSTVSFISGQSLRQSLRNCAGDLHTLHSDPHQRRCSSMLPPRYKQRLSLEMTRSIRCAFPRPTASSRFSRQRGSCQARHLLPIYIHCASLCLAYSINIQSKTLFLNCGSSKCARSLKRRPSFAT